MEELQPSDARVLSLLRDLDSETIQHFLDKLSDALKEETFLELYLFLDLCCKNELTGQPETFLNTILKESSKATERELKDAMDKVLTHLEAENEKGSDQQKMQTKKRIKVFLNLGGSSSGQLLLERAVTVLDKSDVLRLLKLGADMCAKNSAGESMVAKLDPDIIEKFMDSQFKTSQDMLKPHQQTLDFDFSFLEASDVNDYWTPQARKGPRATLLLELMRHPKHKQLILHPVLKAFVTLRWKEVYVLYSINVALTIFTCLATTLFVLATYGGESLTISLEQTGLVVTLLTLGTPGSRFPRSFKMAG